MNTPLTELPGYTLWFKGHTRADVEFANRAIGRPCYCCSLWTGWCDFCTGLAEEGGARWQEQLAEQARLAASPSIHDYARAAEALDFPTDTAFARRVWELASHRLGEREGRELYHACGYIPFCGFPLARAGKLPHMTRAEVEHELATNPLCKLD